MKVTILLFGVFSVLCLSRVVSKDIHDLVQYHVDVTSNDNDTETESPSSFSTKIPYFPDRVNPWLDESLMSVFHNYSMFYREPVCRNCMCYSGRAWGFMWVDSRCYKNGEIDVEFSVNMFTTYESEYARDVIQVDEYVPCHRWDIICQFADFTGFLQLDIYTRSFIFFLTAFFFAFHDIIWPPPNIDFTAVNDALNNSNYPIEEEMEIDNIDQPE